MSGKLFPFKLFVPGRLALIRSLCGLALLMPVSTLASDSLLAGDSTLTGKLKEISDDMANFSIAGTDSSVKVATDELKNLTTDDPRLVIYGDDKSIDGTVEGLADGNLTVRTADGKRTQVPLDQIVSVGGPASGNFDQWTRDNLRYWSGSLDLSASTSQATTDTTQILFGASARRKSEKSELNLGASYRYGTQKEDGKPTSTNLDEAIGTIKARRTVWEQLFVFGEMAATYNAIQKLSLRAQPSTGAGWDILDNDHGRLSAKAGFGGVFERYFGGTKSEYPALVLGMDGDWDLPLDSTLTAGVEYQPSVTNFTENYLVQARLTYTVPVISFLNFKVQITDDYNSSPADNTQRNSFYFNVGLSFTL